MPDADRLIAVHLRLAGEALAGTRALLEIGNRNAAYLVEQAIENLVLALAQCEGIHYHRGQHHQLDTMVRLLPPENPFVEGLRALTWLEAFATTFRYPRPRGDLSRSPEQEALERAVLQATDILERMASYFGVDLDVRSRAPARTIEPPRLDGSGRQGGPHAGS